MKIIDCITYFNEPLLFELRLNILNEYVDEFLICEAKFTHAGERKKLNFNIKDYEKFKKINYLVVENELMTQLIQKIILKIITLLLI